MVFLILIKQNRESLFFVLNYKNIGCVSLWQWNNLERIIPSDSKLLSRARWPVAPPKDPWKRAYPKKPVLIHRLVTEYALFEWEQSLFSFLWLGCSDGLWWGHLQYWGNLACIPDATWVLSKDLYFLTNVIQNPPTHAQHHTSRFWICAAWPDVYQWKRYLRDTSYVLFQAEY